MESYIRKYILDIYNAGGILTAARKEQTLGLTAIRDRGVFGFYGGFVTATEIGKPSSFFFFLSFSALHRGLQCGSCLDLIGLKLEALCIGLPLCFLCSSVCGLRVPLLEPFF